MLPLPGKGFPLQHFSGEEALAREFLETSIEGPGSAGELLEQRDQLEPAREQVE